MWPVIGQDRAVSFLRQSLAKGVVAHAYLFVGPPRVGKMTLALALAQALNCQAEEVPCGRCSQCQRIGSSNHADVQIIGLDYPDDDEKGARNRTKISVGQVKHMQHTASLAPYEGKCRMFIFEGAERLSIGAANRLLKTLEEPPQRVVFVLLTTDERLLPPTVVSRCQRLKLHPLARGQVAAALTDRQGIDPEKAALLARLSRGHIGWAVAAASDEKLFQQRRERLEGLVDIITGDYEMRFGYAARLAGRFAQKREEVWEVLDLWLDFWRDLLLYKLGLKEDITNIDIENSLADRADDFDLAEIRNFIDSIVEAKRQLGLNANPRLVLEVMMLNMPTGKGSKVTNYG